MSGDLQNNLKKVLEPSFVDDDLIDPAALDNVDIPPDVDLTDTPNGSDPKTAHVLKLREIQATAMTQKIEHLSQMHNLRRTVALFVFGIIFIWLVCVMGLVFFGSYDVTYFKGSCVSYEYHSWMQKLIALPEGCTVLKNGNFLNLSESIVIALITTTTANVLGLSYIVAKWLFPKPQHDTSDITPAK